MLESKPTLEKHIEKNENKRLHLELKMEALEREVSTFLSDLNLTPEKLTTFVTDQNNFTSDNWEELQQQRKALDEKLHRDLKNIPDPRQVKKAYAERQIDPRWLFVK